MYLVFYLYYLYIVTLTNIQTAYFYNLRCIDKEIARYFVQNMMEDLF